jgi:hypothetical protein
MSALSRHVRSQWLVLGVVVVAVGWLGCATSNGDPITDDTPLAKPPGSSTQKQASGDPERPAFEAGFEEPDAGNTDPTPDGGDTCVDNNDPGSSENTARALADTSDSQNAPVVVNGVLNGPVDVDFYKINVADTSFHLLQPDTQLKTSGVEMCVFVKCPSGSTSSVTCNGGGVAKKSDIGTDGCCASGPSAATPTWNCSGVNDSATLFFRIKQTANKCSPYSFSYAF